MIYFVRHGQTNDNLKFIISGSNRDVSLNENGKKQAKQTAEKLKDVKIDICFCSPMKRAKQTAKEILKFHKNVPIFFDERIKERNFGMLDGVVDENGILYSKNWDMKLDLTVTGMETIDEIYNRVKSFYDEILKKYPDKNILVVAHNGIARVSCCYFYGFPENGNLNIYEVDNSEIKVFDKVKSV